MISITLKCDCGAESEFGVEKKFLDEKFNIDIESDLYDLQYIEIRCWKCDEVRNLG